MKLKHCTYGSLVQDNQTKEIGMVVGITNNIVSVLSEEQKDPERAIPLIQWQSGKTSGIHHENISPLS